MNKSIKMVMLSAGLIFSVGAISSDIFDNYSSSSGGTYTASNGNKYYYGGSFNARINRNPIDLAGFQPPSISAGCGGIDMFAGSFSIISRDEIVQAMRGIAQGAPSYFFQLALGSVCKDCENLMAQIQNKLSELNQWGKMTCEQASNALINATNIDPRNAGKLLGMGKGANKEAADGTSPSMMDKIAELDLSPNSVEGFKLRPETLAEFTTANWIADAMAEVNMIDIPIVNLMAGSTDLTRRKIMAVELLSSLAGVGFMTKIESAIDCEATQPGGCVKVEIIRQILDFETLFRGSDGPSQHSIYQCGTNPTSGATSLAQCADLTSVQIDSDSADYSRLFGFTKSIDDRIRQILNSFKTKTNLIGDNLDFAQIANWNFLNIALIKNDDEKEAVTRIVKFSIEEAILDDLYKDLVYLINASEQIASRDGDSAFPYVESAETSRRNLEENYKIFKEEIENNKKDYVANMLITSQIEAAKKAKELSDKNSKKS